MVHVSRCVIALNARLHNFSLCRAVVRFLAPKIFARFVRRPLLPTICDICFRNLRRGTKLELKTRRTERKFLISRAHWRKNESYVRILLAPKSFIPMQHTVAIKLRTQRLCVREFWRQKPFGPAGYSVSLTT